MGQPVSEEVEAAAAAMWFQRPMRRDPEGAPIPFAETADYQKIRYRGMAKVAVDAAGPIIYTQTIKGVASGLRGWYEERVNADRDCEVVLTEYETGREVGITEGILAAALKAEASLRGMG